MAYRLFTTFAAFLLFFCFSLPPAQAQPYTDQEWNTNVTIASDAITVACAEFFLPIDLGRLLSEVDPISVEGEMSESMRSSHLNKITLQPQSGTSDTLATISGCSIDGALFIISPQDVGDTITLVGTGNIEPPGGTNLAVTTTTPVILVLRGSTYYVIAGGGSGGGGGGGITKTITDATDISSSFSVGNGPNGIRLYADSTSAYLECFLGGSPCPPKIIIPAGEALEFLDGTTVAFEIFPDAGSPNAMYHFAPGYQLLGSAEWGAWNMFGDGTECDTDPTGTPPTQGIACPMAGTETDGTIEGTPITWRGDWDKTADLTFHIKAYLVTDSGAGTWHGQIAIQCVAAGAQKGAYGVAGVDPEAAGLDLTPVIGDVVGNEIHDVAAAVVDTDTTGADCDPGDTLYWQFTSCDTDATPSTGCTSSAGFEATMSISSIRAEHKRNSLSE